jgi:hypothetical protein
MSARVFHVILKNAHFVMEMARYLVHRTYIGSRDALFAEGRV